MKTHTEGQPFSYLIKEQLLSSKIMIVLLKNRYGLSFPTYYQAFLIAISTLHI